MFVSLHKCFKLTFNYPNSKRSSPYPLSDTKDRKITISLLFQGTQTITIKLSLQKLIQ